MWTQCDITMSTREEVRLLPPLDVAVAMCELKASLYVNARVVDTSTTMTALKSVNEQGE